MRFIGSKKNIVSKIEKILSEHTSGNEHTFLDLFAGSNAVGDYFSNKYKIISNDIMYFSYVLARGSLGIKMEPKFINLQKQGIEDPFKYFNNIDPDTCEPDFVTKEYSPFGSANRDRKSVV